MDCGSCIEKQTQLQTFLTNFLFCRKWYFFLHFSRRDSTVNSIVAPELNYRGWRFKWGEHIMLYIFHERIYFLTDFMMALFDSFVLVTSAFWQKLFFCGCGGKQYTHHKKKKKEKKKGFLLVQHRLTKKETFLVFLIASVAPAILWLSLHQYAAEPKPPEWKIICFLLVCFKVDISSISMNDFKLVRFDDKYLFIVLQITYFTGLP